MWLTSVPNALQAVWKFFDKNAFPPSTTITSGMIKEGPQPRAAVGHPPQQPLVGQCEVIEQRARAGQYGAQKSTGSPIRVWRNAVPVAA
ncbi:hypothetical protein GA0115260_107941 [Streptomyces sp. MnatMP-M27]|uniref:hypothetical protein n=1 Tax=Streptomyces sp. MnatMP-M27 TaxID=1839768 RepID=UPI00081E9959|nr:hypothetical protein [Streptomyces sp. MnatMP-M27]SCG06167.1 hypothetical protein GA0115260_107941 [Streptomyces sp. MnatMP-M27]